MIRTYKRKLNLTIAQEKRLRSWIGATRCVYNLALEIRIEAYKKCQKSVDLYELKRQCTALRKDVSWINDAPSESLFCAIGRLDNAYKRFFKGAGFPKWASKKGFKSITFNQCLKAENNKIKVSKIGWLKLYKDKEVIGDIKEITIKIEPTGFFASITCDNAQPNFTSENQAVGLDMGLKHFCIDSSGRFIANPKHFAKYERKLRIENRSLSRKIKRSKSWYRQAKKLSLLHHKIANVRKDFLHKESTKIAKSNNIVYMENLNISGMSKNHNLSKHILDAGWGMFKTMLEYKTKVVKINPAYTSQSCFVCSHVDKANRASQSEFICTNCGHTDNADINAAKNIKHQGMMLDRKRKAVA